jgi:predicted outer membrane protein
MRKFVFLASAAALALSVSAALAQEAGKAKTPAPAAPHTAISIECSKQADAKGLHGEARRTFRSKCKREAGKGK